MLIKHSELLVRKVLRPINIDPQRVPIALTSPPPTAHGSPGAWFGWPAAVGPRLAGCSAARLTLTERDMR